ncbi:MAG: hypothetical protein ABJE79_11700 [Marinomonas sp.]
MSQVIRITDELYERLKSHAEGFDTPASVVERVLNSYEANGFKPVLKMPEVIPAVNLEISYGGKSESAFKESLIKNKFAYITLFFTNGEVKTKRWNASKFSEESNLGGNLRSGFLRGWRKKGISKAELSFSEPTDV